MRRFPLIRLLVPCIAGLTACVVRADGGKPCGRCDCPPPPDCVQGPAPKVIVEMSPPEVVFQEAPGAAVPCEKPCFLKRAGHRCWHRSCCVQPAYTPVSTVAVQQAAIPAVSASLVPMQTTAMAVQATAVPIQTSAVSLASVPQIAAAPVAAAALPVASMAVAQPSYAMAAVPQVAAVQPQASMMAVALVPAGCQSAGGAAGAADNGRMSEADVRAAVLTLRKLNAAMVAEKEASARSANGQLGASSLQQSEFDRRLEELRKKVEGLDRSLQAILDKLQNR